MVLQGELKRRARAAGISGEMLDAADDADSPVEAVVSLLLAGGGGGSGGGGGGAAAGTGGGSAAAAAAAASSGAADPALTSAILKLKAENPGLGVKKLVKLVQGAERWRALLLVLVLLRLLRLLALLLLLLLALLRLLALLH